MSFGTKSVKTPDDPDPSPTTTSDTSADVQSARRQETKRTAKQYGRSRTILAGETSGQETAGRKTTILGG